MLIYHTPNGILCKQPLLRAQHMKNHVSPRRHSALKPCALAALLSLAAAPLAHAADSLANHLPKDSLAVAEWAGADALKTQYAGSNLQGVVDSTNLPSLLLKQITNAPIPYREGKGLSDQEQAILAAMWKYQGAIAILPVDFTAFANGGDIAPRAVYIINAENNGNARTLVTQLSETLADLKKQHPEMPPISIHPIVPPPQANSDTTPLVAILVGTLTPEELSAVDSRNASFAATDTYTKAAANFRKDAALNVLIDAPQILAAIEEGIAKDSDLTDAQRALAKNLIDPLGVRSLTTITYSAGFDGKEWSEKTLVGMTKDRHGLLSLVDFKPLTPDILKCIPKDTPSLNIVRLDLDRAFKDFHAIMEKSNPDDLKDFDQGVADMNQRLGFDLEKDLLAPLGDTWSVYRLGAAGDQNASFALINPLRDAKTFSPTIDKVATLGGAFLKVTNETVGDAKVWTIENPQLPISLAIADDKFIISSRLELDDVIAQLKAKSSLLDRPDFITLQKSLPQVPPQSLDFVDLKAVYAQSAAGLKELANEAAGQGIEIPPEAIPEPEKIAAFLTPGMSLTWQDDAGFHLEGKSAFPGAGILSLQQASLAPVVVLGAVTLYPSLISERQNAKMAAESSDERILLMGVMTYTSDTGNGKLPEDIAQLFPTLGGDASSLKSFVSPRSSTKPLEITPEQQSAANKDWKTIQKDLQQHCDFVLTATAIKMSDITNPSEFILIYPKPNVPNTGGTNIGFADGHVEVVSPTVLKSMVEQNNDARKALKLPPLKVDDNGHIIVAQ